MGTAKSTIKINFFNQTYEKRILHLTSSHSDAKKDVSTSVHYINIQRDAYYIFTLANRYSL